MVDKLFSTGRQVYRGYVDDPRHTDNAWIETTAFHFHCPPEIGDKLPLAAGDDAGQVCVALARSRGTDLTMPSGSPFIRVGWR